MSERTQKLVSIRRRTNHDLLVLVNRELERGLTLVDLTTARTAPFFAQAEKAHRTAAAWLARISDLSQDDRLRMEAGLKDLRARLDEVPATARVERYPASVAS